MTSLGGPPYAYAIQFTDLRPMHMSKFYMTNDLTVYMVEQRSLDKFPCLCAGNGFWTAEQQAKNVIQK